VSFTFNPYKDFGESSFRGIAIISSGSYTIDDVSLIARPDLDATADALDASYHYEPTRNDKGLYIGPGDSCSYTNCPTYRKRFSFNVRIQPQFPSDIDASAPDKYIFDYNYDSNNAFRLFYDCSDSDWVLNIRSGGTDNTTIRTTNAQTFVIGDYVEIGGWYDYEGRDIEGTTYYGKIFVNGVEAGSVTSAITPPTNHPTNLNIGHLAFANQAECVFDEVNFFILALYDQDITKLHTESEPLQNVNATISYTGTLNANDILTIVTQSGDSEFYDASAGTEASADSNLSGRNPALRGTEDEFGMLYIPSAIAGKLRVIFRPHFR
jgi:hypothetical protein